MKTLVLFLFCIMPLVSLSQTDSLENNISTVNDTVYNNDKPYCLLTEEDGSYIIRNLYLEKMAQIKPVLIGSEEYYKLDIPLQYKQIYIKPVNDDFFNIYIQCMIVNEAIDIDGYYDEFGTTLLIKDLNSRNLIISEADIDSLRSKQKLLNWSIMFEKTNRQDSTNILADGIIRGYYIKTSFQDLGVDRYAVAHSNDYAYHRYYIFNNKGVQVAEIRKPWDGITMTVIISDEELKFRYLPKDKNIVTLTTKILLAKKLL